MCSKIVLLLYGFSAHLLTITDIYGSTPQNITTPTLSFTGQQFKPQVITTPALSFAGQQFKPQVITTPALTFTGQQFESQVITTPALSFTGQQFKPQVITTPALSFTGQQFKPQVIRTPPLHFSGNRIQTHLTSIKSNSLANQKIKPVYKIILAAKENKLREGDKARIEIKMKNIGKGESTARMLYSYICSPECPFRKTSEHLQSITPGEELVFSLETDFLKRKTYAIQLKTPYGTSNRLTLKVADKATTVRKNQSLKKEQEITVKQQAAQKTKEQNEASKRQLQPVRPQKPSRLQ